MAKEKALDFNKDGKIRFYCRQKMYSFRLNVLDENGKVKSETDIHGNNKIDLNTRYTFTEVPQYDADTKKAKVLDPWCMIEVSVDDVNSKRLVEYLTKANGNKSITKIFTEAEYEEIRNPEAYRAQLEANKKLEEKDNKIADLEKEIASLKAKK